MFLGVYLNTINMLVHFPEETTDFFSPEPPPSPQINWFRRYWSGAPPPVPMKQWDISLLRHMPARRVQGLFYRYIPQLYSVTSENRRVYCPYKLSCLNVNFTMQEISFQMDVQSFEPHRERRAHIHPPQQLKHSNQLIITSFTYHPAHGAEFFRS
jgi:hypothetical protein